MCQSETMIKHRRATEVMSEETLFSIAQCCDS